MTVDMLALRPYQEDALTAIIRGIADGVLRPAVVLPTGAGKTVIFSHLSKYWHESTGKRVLILVHRDELVTQTERKLHAVAPHLTTGVVKAKRAEIGADVIIGSVQTLRKLNRRADIQNVGLVIVDEAHHAAADSYVQIMEHFGCFTETPAVGFSATLVRSDKGDLSTVWQKVVEQKDILDMIPEFLCDVRGKLITVDGLSLGEVMMNRGDLAAGSLTDALLSADAQNYVVRGFLEHASDRPTIVFVPTVEATEVFADAFSEAGITVGRVWGSMPDEERRPELKRFAEGEIQVLVNCMVLTEGYDEPKASCAIIARATRSPALYVQMVGRVLRKFPGKTDALVLDVVGASMNFKLATLADLTSRRVVEILPGESLAEAAIREREAGNPNLANYVISTRDVDLFHRSPSAWLTTYEGVWFLNTRCGWQHAGCPEFPNRTEPCGSHLYFLWPTADAKYRVGKRPTRKQGGKWLTESVDLEFAMEWAEQLAFDEDPSLADRRASWRRKNESATDAQINRARLLRLEFDEKRITKRELSDMMSVKMASDILDPAIRGKR